MTRTGSRCAICARPALAVRTKATFDRLRDELSKALYDAGVLVTVNQG
jgi:hypothetical protein